jgi:hypothetical protein
MCGGKHRSGALKIGLCPRERRYAITPRDGTGYSGCFLGREHA